MKRLIPVILLAAAFAAIAAISLVNAITLAQSPPLSYPAPPPKPTMTVTLRMDESVKKWTVDVPTLKEPSREEFTIDPAALKPNADGLVKCRLFFEYDEK